MKTDPIAVRSGHVIGTSYHCIIINIKIQKNWIPSSLQVLVVTMLTNSPPEVILHILLYCDVAGVLSLETVCGLRFLVTDEKTGQSLLV